MNGHVINLGAQELVERRKVALPSANEMHDGGNNQAVPINYLASLEGHPYKIRSSKGKLIGVCIS